MHKLTVLFFLTFALSANQIEKWVEDEKNKFKESALGYSLQAGPISQLFEGKPVLSCFRNSTNQNLNCEGISDKLFSVPEFLEAALNYGEGKKFQINTIINDIKFINEFVIYDSKVNYVIKSDDETTFSIIPLSKLLNITDIDGFEILFAEFADYRYLVKDNQLETGEFYLENQFLIIREGNRYFGNGEFFEGEFDEFGGLLYGNYSYSNGEKYIGNFENNFKSGYGEYSYNNGNVYKGNYFEDAAHGFGVLYYKNGDIYEGEFKFNKLTGEAKFTFGDIGYTVFATFVDGATKSGTQYDSEGRIIYTGDYLLKPGSLFIRHGKGKLFLYTDYGVETYEGEFKNDDVNGYGKYISRGVIYTGEFKDNQFTGEGKMQGAGYYYEGVFENYQITEGKAVYKDWEYHGKWVNGQYDGEAKLITKNPDGSEFEEFVQFKNGVYIGEIESDPTLFKITAQKRYALVIGNGNYSASYGYANLDNPTNDAELMHARLESAGFEVTTITNVNEADFLNSINDFKNRLDNSGKGTVALFYYSGHGLQVDGVNYLVPTDAQIENEFDLEAENISTRRIMSALEGNTDGTNIIILDACRNNPFERTFKRGGNSGLVAMDAPTGTYIAYSTAPGKLAADGTGNNSLFTQSLANNILKESLSIEDVFKITRRDVAEQTNNKQVPWSSSSLIGDFYFIP